MHKTVAKMCVDAWISCPNICMRMYRYMHTQSKIFCHIVPTCFCSASIQHSQSAEGHKSGLAQRKLIAARAC